MRDELRRIVEVHTVGAIRKFVAQAVLRGEIDEAFDQLRVNLIVVFLNEIVEIELRRTRIIDLGKFISHRVLHRRLLLGGVCLLALHANHVLFTRLDNRRTPTLITRRKRRRHLRRLGLRDHLRGD